MKYNVEVQENLSRIITVGASTPEEAAELVRAKYEDSEIVLDSNDMIGEETIEVLEDEVPDDFEADYVVKSKE
jgi:hypothetical protein